MLAITDTEPGKDFEKIAVEDEVEEVITTGTMYL